MDAFFNLATMKLGWMNPFYGTPFEALKRMNRNVVSSDRKGPTRSDYLEAVELLKRADQMGHIQAKHRLAMIYARGLTINDSVVVPPNCPKALKFKMAIAESGPTIAKRMRTAYKQYVAGNYGGSLRNYIAAAETGSVEAQVNAAFLFEQGFCLGMNRLNCMKASVRMWRAAARQGDEEACLRVGDFYYYGRLREDIDFDDKFDAMVRRDIDYSIAPIPWIRYVLYPEDILFKAKKAAVKGIRLILTRVSQRRDNGTLRRLEKEGFCSNNADEGKPSCTNTNDQHRKVGKDQSDHFEIAAHYYRKAADDHGSARANFNLGFMHEWGLGLTQDFPLAKRFYDIAAKSKNGEGEVAVQIALLCMNMHESVVKAGLVVQKWYNSRAPSDITVQNGEHHHFSADGSPGSMQGIMIYHFLSIDTAIILLLVLLLTVLIQHRLARGR